MYMKPKILDSTVPATLFLTFLSCSIVRVSYRIVRVSYRIVRVSYRIVYQVFRFLSCFAFIRSIVYRVLRVSGFPFIVSCIFGNYRDHNLNIRKMYDTFRKLHSFCLRSYFQESRKDKNNKVGYYKVQKKKKLNLLSVQRW